MSNWLIKERQHLNYGIEPLQPGEAISFIKAAFIFLNFIQYYRFIHRTDILIIEMTILYKKEFTDTFDFYPSPNHCQISLSFTCSHTPFWRSFRKIPSNCFKDIHALILWVPVSNQKMQLPKNRFGFLGFLWVFFWVLVFWFFFRIVKNLFNKLEIQRKVQLEFSP